MIVVLVTVSFLLQGLNTFLAFRLAWLQRHVAWFILGVAMLFATIRRVQTLTQLWFLHGAPNYLNEALGLGFSILMLLALVALERAAARRERTMIPAAAKALTGGSQLSGLALSLGLLAMVGSVGVGLYAYQASREAILDKVFTDNMALAHTLSADVSALGTSRSRAQILTQMQELWERISTTCPQTTLLVIGADGRLWLFTGSPEHMGQDVGALALRDHEGTPTTIQSLLAARTDWTGRLAASDQPGLLLAFTYNRQIEALIGVQGPQEVADDQAYATALPWTMGFGLITLILFPGALLLLHRAHDHAQQTVQRTTTALRQSEERFQQMAEHIEAIFWLIAPAQDRQPIYLSPAFQRLTGYTPECLDTSLQGWANLLVHPEDRARTQRVFLGWLAGCFADVEYRLVRSDGAVRWMRSRPFPIYDEVDRLVRIAGLTTDVTDRREAGEVLRASQERLKAILDAIPDPAWLKDPEGRFVVVNAAWRQFTGQDTRAIIGQTSFQVFPREIAEKLHKQDLDIIRWGKQEQYEEVLQDRDGHPTWFETIKGPLYDERGAVVGTVGIARNITERKRSEQALHESRHLAQEIINTTPDLLYIYDLIEGRNVFANREITVVLGYTPEQVQTMGVSFLQNLLHPDDRAAVKKHHQGFATARLGEVRYVEYRMRHADGQWRWLRSKDTVFALTSDGQARQIIGTAVDITERRRVEDALRASEERYRGLAGRLQLLLRELDHRVKNNLTALYALVDRYARTAPDVPTLAQEMHGKLLAMKAVHEIIAQAEWQSIALATLLKDLAAQFVADLGPANQFDISGPPLQIAPRQAGPLAMVLQELFSNCCKHGAYRLPTGSVRLTWEVLEIRDRATRVRFLWRETGGPAIAPPRQYRQGLKLIEGFAKFELAGQSEMQFDATGFQCALVCFLDAPEPALRAAAAAHN